MSEDSLARPRDPPEFDRGSDVDGAAGALASTAARPVFGDEEATLRVLRDEPEQTERVVRRWPERDDQDHGEPDRQRAPPDHVPGERPVSEHAEHDGEEHGGADSRKHEKSERLGI